jgi:signal transduction histidine kinase
MMIEALFATVRILQPVVFGLLATASVVTWRRRRGEPAAWLAVTFALLAALVVIFEVLPGSSGNPVVEWTRKSALAALALFPYLLYRFFASFEGTSRALHVGALALSAAVAAGALLIPVSAFDRQPRALEVQLWIYLLMLQWLVLSAIVVVGLWKAGRRQPKVARRRMQMLSIGPILLTAALFLAGLSDTSADTATPLDLTIQTFALLAAPFFFMGFAPPYLLRAAWRRTEEPAIREAELALMTAESWEEIAEKVLPHVARLLGANVSLLTDPQGRLIGTHGIPEEEAKEVAARLAGAGHYAATKTEKQVLAQKIISGWLAQHLTSGLLAVKASPFAPFFGSDEMLELRGMSTVIELALQRVKLLERERRRADNLDRLHRALRAVTATPELSPTLKSIAESAREAVGAKFVTLMFREDDHLSLAAISGVEIESPSLFTERSSEALASPHSPISEVLQTGRSVIIDDVDKLDASLTPWTSSLRARHDFGSLVVVPLHSAEKPIGVLTVHFASAGEVPDEDVSLLIAYAERASILIARTLAYHQEKEAAERLRQADQLKSEFMATVSHELRTPLTAVQGFVDTILKHWDRMHDSKRREFLTIASTNASELNRLIEQLLDFSRLERGPAEIEPHPHRLADEVVRIVETMGPLLEKHRIGIDVPLDLWVLADRQALRHILSNLLTNAVKFAPEASKIRISAASRPPEAVVSVSNEGPEIPEDEHQRIFESFYQVDRDPAGRSGAGLGLSIVRRYVEMHGGRAWVESAPGDTVKFLFTLPVAERKAARVTQPSERAAGEAPPR